ncbi:hypothetical protein C9374_004623 [Naegleria lovaniensis]|uniref:Solute-binding protein family 3/N-terminal domain-containing protein n=1 Tax=Naegleria lovaniensis TaxID=51637 RepID=A0AA88KP39_NAELO|nr:uncharacterized protein C9374_004623 [Naegleria lovaniensis]KAG2383286.1 hypothetical protein C9374_004623 [Naegleria lovaniensis]
MKEDISVVGVREGKKQNNKLKKNLLSLVMSESSLLQQFVRARITQQPLVHLLIISSIIWFLMLQVSCQSNFVGIPKSFADALDAATSSYVVTKEWTNYLEERGILFPVPECVGSPQYPPFINISRNYINICFDMESSTPWKEIYMKSGEMIARAIKEHYQFSNFTANFKPTSMAKGFFSTLKTQVDTGVCDIVTSCVSWNDERKAQVKFNCAYGKSFQSVLRSGRDNSTSFKTVDDLNKPGMTIVVSPETIHDKWAAENLKQAQLVKMAASYDEIFPMIQSGKYHAFIADAIDIYQWYSRNKNNCSGCSVIVFGDSQPFGSFITNKIIDSGSCMRGSLSSMILFVALQLVLVVICKYI